PDESARTVELGAPDNYGLRAHRMASMRARDKQIADGDGPVLCVHFHLDAPTVRHDRLVLAALSEQHPWLGGNYSGHTSVICATAGNDPIRVLRVDYDHGRSRKTLLGLHPLCDVLILCSDVAVHLDAARDVQLCKGTRRADADVASIVDSQSLLERSRAV